MREEDTQRGIDGALDATGNLHLASLSDFLPSEEGETYLQSTLRSGVSPIGRRQREKHI